MRTIAICNRRSSDAALAAHGWTGPRVPRELA